MKVAIVQSNYVPWKGYFDLIASVDRFVLYDDAQYTRNDWRNRNRIKTAQGLKWLTVPVLVSGRLGQSIRTAEIDTRSEWAPKHWKTLTQSYAKATHFDSVSTWLEPLYLGARHTHLSPLNRSFIEAICGYLGIATPLLDSCEFPLAEGRTRRLVDLCLQLGATEYVSGPSAARYIEPELFEEAGIALTYFDYSGYPRYAQLWGDFTHNVSVLDVLFNCGPGSRDFIRRMTCGSQS